MNLEYALVTSTSLPEQVKAGSNYVSLDKAQWMDLVDYSEDLVNDDPEQRVLLLICARGTADQEEADKLKSQELSTMESETRRKLEEAEALQKDRQEELNARQSNRADLRKKSKSLFNALYGK